MNQSFAAEHRSQEPSPGEGSGELSAILQYISDSWQTLTRSMDDCKTFEDIKTEGRPALYLPADILTPSAVSDLQNHCPIRIERLPRRMTRTAGATLTSNQPNGLLYLEHPYVVPGGQFNEMYGWDSYFIIRGLLEQNRIDLAKGMVDNFFFEIENYGGVLNANRTYYLSRSQPPFLSSMVLAVHEANAARGEADIEWLRKAYKYVVRDYEEWVRPPHLAGETGLSRYFDRDQGPVPEIMGDPSHYYRGVAHYFLMHEGPRSPHLILLHGPSVPEGVIGPTFPVYVCDADSDRMEAAQCEEGDRMALTADFYKGDRAMRESGFDVSFRFGPFGAETHHFAPVCLNSLLYKTEKDLEKIADVLGKKAEAQEWGMKAAERKYEVVKYLWDGSRGLFFDYDFTKGRRSSYEYATTFYPLWAGLASEEQARSVAKNLSMFEQEGGIAMSRRETQAQWDYPYGWAPVQLLAVEGLRRFGYDRDANRVAYKFLANVLQNFVRDGDIHEKYDVTKDSSKTNIHAGYAQNFVGFGWTNGVFLELLKRLSPADKARLERDAKPSNTSGALELEKFLE